jgi:site-specific DNA-methyltransferase (adenine-specific)
MDWSTPQDLFDKLNEEFHFTLDPCADALNHKCDKYYTEEQDGLHQDWSGERVFCNPPYGRSLSKWVEKSYKEVREGKCELVVMLIPARTDTSWFHDYILRGSVIRFVKGRIKFGGAKNNAPFPSMIVVFESWR